MASWLVLCHVSLCLFSTSDYMVSYFRREDDLPLVAKHAYVWDVK